MRGLFLFSIMTLFIVGCKKYDEGPSLSLRTKMSRITGEWTLKTWSSNGKDMINYYGEYSDLTCFSNSTVIYRNEYITSKETWKFDKNGDFTLISINKNKELNYDLSYDLCDDYYDETSETYTVFGSWKFNSNKEEIEIVFNETPNEIYIFQIKQLKNNELKFESLEDSELNKYYLTK